MNKKPKIKPQYAWFPISSTGIIWTQWAQPNRRKLIIELRERLYDYNSSGFTIERCEVRPVKIRRKRK